MLFGYSGIDGIVVKAFVIGGIRVSLSNLRTSRLHSRRNPEAWYTRLTARPKVNTPCLLLSYSFVIYLFLSLFNDLCYLVIQGLIAVKAPVIAGTRVSLANLCTSRLHSRRNPVAWYTRLTARPKVNTPCLLLSYSFVIYLFLS